MRATPIVSILLVAVAARCATSEIERVVGETKDPEKVVESAKRILIRSTDQLAKVEAPSELRDDHDALIRTMRRMAAIGAEAESNPFKGRQLEQEYETLGRRLDTLTGRLKLAECGSAS